MKENKTKMFTGCREVFSFTAGQAIKGKGFKSSTILISLAIAVIMIVVCLASGGSDAAAEIDDFYETLGDVVDAEGKYDFKTINNIYVLNETSYSSEDILKLFSVTENNLKRINALESIDSITEDISKNKNAVVLDVISEEDQFGNSLKVNILLTYESEVDEDEVDVLGEILVYETTLSVKAIGSFDEDYIDLPTISEAVNTNKEEESFGTLLAKMIIPMVFCLLMYMIILIHGQSISKAIVADKASKLMEMLLTSVRPYAIIAGKILGVATVAMMQILIWIASGIIGYIIGNEIAGNLYPDYVNVVGELIKIMQSDTNGVAFSLASIILAVAGTLVGFFIYCVLAGLSGALVSKVEDLSAASTVFQLPVIVAFFVAYFSNFATIDGGGNTIFNKVINIFPLTSPFTLPSGILVGNMSILEGVISLVVMIISALVLIIVTGKIYKGKIFNRH